MIGIQFVCCIFRMVLMQMLFHGWWRKIIIDSPCIVRMVGEKNILGKNVEKIWWKIL